MAEIEPEIYVLEDENGREVEFTELFSFKADNNGKTYIILKALDPEVEGVLAYTVNPEDEAGELIPLETEAEFDMVEEVMNTILNNPEL